MTSTTTCVPGSRCAELLFELGLSLPSVVRALMNELDLTYHEAIEAARNAGIGEE